MMSHDDVEAAVPPELPEVVLVDRRRRSGVVATGCLDLFLEDALCVDEREALELLLLDLPHQAWVDWSELGDLLGELIVEA